MTKGEQPERLEATELSTKLPGMQREDTKAKTKFHRKAAKATKRDLLFLIFVGFAALL